MSDQTNKPAAPAPPSAPVPENFPELDNQLVPTGNDQAGYDEYLDTEMSEMPPDYVEGEYVEEPYLPANPHIEHAFSSRNFVCVRCGSTNLADGYMVDYGEKFEQIRFAPRRTTLRWLNSVMALRPWKSLAKLEAVACRDCGAVLPVVNPEELRRAERKR